MKTLLTMLMVIVGFTLILPINVIAAQFDAPYYAFEQRNKANWAEQDRHAVRREGHSR